MRIRLKRYDISYEINFKRYPQTTMIYWKLGQCYGTWQLSEWTLYVRGEPIVFSLQDPDFFSTNTCSIEDYHAN